MEYGQKIAALRKSKGLTQVELGNELNVTYQAVSKWERGESYPDFETLSKIAKIFGVPITYFEDGIIPDNTAVYAPPAPEPAPAPAPAMLGVCTMCGKVIFEGSEGETSPALVCADCVQRRDAAKRQAAENEKAKARRAKQQVTGQAKRMRNRGLIVAGIVCAVFLALLITGIALNPTDVGAAIGGGCLITLFLFTFISQLFWHGIVVDVCLAGFKIIGTPGIIFTFDLDGFIFLIVMKILFALLKFFVLLICMLFCITLAMIMSPFTFIPATVKLSRGILPD